MTLEWCDECDEVREHDIKVKIVQPNVPASRRPARVFTCEECGEESTVPIQ